jgi:aspartyl-tRNA(Asn)/glutamyl-tRNA(Gln) amidotransferase subunit C
MKTMLIYSWKVWPVYPVQTAILEIEHHTNLHTTCQMKVTEKDVAYVADLANVELADDERGGMLRDLNSILEYIDRLNQLDTTNVSPMAQVSDRHGVDESKTGSALFAYASREDILEGLRKSLPHEVALENAPDTDGTFFKVPKVIER